VPIPLVGVFALLGRIVGLGLERPWVKALGRERGSIAATTLSFGLAVLLITPIVVWQYATGSFESFKKFSGRKLRFKYNCISNDDTMV